MRQPEVGRAYPTRDGHFVIVEEVHDWPGFSHPVFGKVIGEPFQRTWHADGHYQHPHHPLDLVLPTGVDPGFAGRPVC